MMPWQLFLEFHLSAASKQQLKTDILLGGQANDGYWTTAWINLHIHSRLTQQIRTTVKNRLRDLFKYFMNLAEYQLS